MDGLAITNYQYSTDNGTTWKNRTDGQTTSSPIIITQLSENTNNLINGTSYNIKIRAVNSLGEGDASAQIGPFVPYGLPIVTTGSVSSVTSTSMTFGATVNANGNTTTSVKFQYGTSATLNTFSEVNANNTSVSGAINTSVSASLSGQPTSAYYYRIVATNDAGTTTGNIQAIPYSSSGGTKTTTGSYTVHTFTGSGTLSITGVGSKNIEYLVVGGGGGGGGVTFTNGLYQGGGGGAGGFKTGTLVDKTANSYTVIIGAGGNSSSNGNDSVFDSVTSKGGGYGGVGGGFGGVEVGGNGASGGGGSTGSGTGLAGGTGMSGQGNDGGAGGSFNVNSGGAGGGGGASAVGGAGVAGSSSSDGNGGNGGNGSSSSITGSSVTYAGGGGGGADSRASGGGNGGTGGGGRGAISFIFNAVDGAVNTGGGGGGGAAFTSGKSGGSGIVIVRYLT